MLATEPESAMPRSAAKSAGLLGSVPAMATYDYAVIRVVPRVEREEFVNVGVIVSCESARLLEARIEMDEARVRASLLRRTR